MTSSARLPPAAPPTPRENGRDEALRLTERLAEDMAQRWQAGEQPLAEEYLAKHPGLAEQPEALLELISEEIALRQEHGRPVEQAEFLRRFPRWRHQVETLLGCHRLLTARLVAPRFPV